ncbi:hypothetical protein ACHAWF_005530, partial [Thalassiosira exigua]
ATTALDPPLSHPQVSQPISIDAGAELRIEWNLSRMSSPETSPAARRAKNPANYRYYDSEDEEEPEREEEASDSNVARRKPIRHGWNHYRIKPTNEFQSVDGSKMFQNTPFWSYDALEPICLSWNAREALRGAEKSLVSSQNEHCIALVRSFGRSTKLTQVPYHADLLPHYEYFSSGIQDHSGLQSFKMVNFNLPPSPWLGKSVLPVLGRICNGTESHGNMTTLALVNCSLSANDLSSLMKFLAENKTLWTLDISRNDIESVDTVKALARAIKKHPILHNIGLGYCSLGGSGNHKLHDGLLRRGEHVTRHLDLSCNWFTDAIVPVVIDMLKNNSTLLSFDLSGNRSLRTHQFGGYYRRWRRIEDHPYPRWERTPQKDAGKAVIVKRALFDTTSLQAICDSNHTCALKMNGNNRGDTYEETIRRINSLDIREGKKIRYKVVLAFDEAKKDLYNPMSFNKVPLELVPYLLEMVQQSIGYNGFGHDFLPKQRMRKTRSRYGPPDLSLRRLYEIITTWQSLPLLFARGAGKLETEKEVAQKKKKKKATRRKRKRFGDADDDDEPWIPKGARTRGKWTWNPDLRKCVYIPPPVY